MRPDFTARELDILACLIKGKSSKSIANLLDISVNTVETHMRHVMTKLGLNSREHIIIYLEKEKDLYKQLLVVYAHFNKEAIPQEDFPNFPLQAETQNHHQKESNKWINLLVLGIGIILLLFIIYKNTLDFSIDKIHMDFPLPSEMHILKRSDVLTQIAQKFKKRQAIQTVVLLGIGGSGKTTLAIQYMQTQNVSVVWGIHASTYEGLISSFEHLAYVLSRTIGEKEELAHIKKVEADQERIKKLLSFVQNKLKKHKAWCLVFENVDNLGDIQAFLPHDPKTWGTGKVLITTRNGLIKDSWHINPHNIIELLPLTDQEKLNLFTKIMQDKTVSKEETQIFLKNIPSFPLDVSIAAHYTKNTQTSYDDYLKKIKEGGASFQKMQSGFLKETADYTKTRYGLISTTMKQLTDINLEFIPLLFLVSTIEPQKIPKSLLHAMKGETLTDQFIRHMHKHSLMNYETKKRQQQNPTLSLHQSSQEIILQHLKLSLTTHEKERYFNKVAETLVQQCESMIEHLDISQIRDFVGHLLTFLKQNPLLSKHNKGLINAQLGRMYYYLSDCRKSEFYLNTGLFFLCQHYPDRNSLAIARTIYYLANVEKSLCNHSQAKKLFEESLKIYQKISPNDHVTISVILLGLGHTQEYLGNHEKAKQAVEHSRKFCLKCCGEMHPNVALASTYLGQVYENLGEYEQAEQFYKKSLNSYQKNYGSYHSRTARIIFRLGAIYKKLGKYSKARKFLEQSSSIFKERYPEDQQDKIWSLTHLGDLYTLIGDYPKAQNTLNTSGALYRKYYGQHHLYVEWDAIFRGQLEISLGNYDRAKELLTNSLVKYEKDFGIDHIKTARAAHHLANVYKYLQDFKKAEPLFQKSLKIHALHYGKEHLAYAFVLRDFGHYYFLKGNLDKAEKIITEALTIFKKSNHPDGYKCLEYLGDLYFSKSKCCEKMNHKDCEPIKKKAKYYFEQALKIATANFPKDSAHTKRIYSKLKACKETLLSFIANAFRRTYRTEEKCLTAKKCS